MDQVGFLVPPAPAPAAAVEYVPSLAGHILSCILSCAANDDLFDEKSCFMLLPAISANLSALEQISVLLEDNSPVPAVKTEGKQSADALANNLRRLCRGVAVLLLKAGAPQSDDDDLSLLTDRQMVQRLSPRHLASVIRGERHSWLRPRVSLYVEELVTLALDLVLHTYVFRLAKLQMSRAKTTSGGFEEELAVRAFAQRFLALRQKNLGQRQEEHEKRFRLREIPNGSDTSSIASSSSRVRRRGSSSGRCPSEAGTSTSTVVDEDLSAPPPPPSGPPEPPLLKTKIESLQPTASTVPLNAPQTAEPVQQAQDSSQSSEKKAAKPGFFKRHLTNLRHRAWNTFSRDAAVLRSLNYHGKPPRIEAWVISEYTGCVHQRQESAEELLREIRRQVKNRTDSFWDAALGLSVKQCNILEDTRIKATIGDLRSRRCILVSDWKDASKTNSGPLEHRTVYFVVDDAEELNTALITDPEGVEFKVPVGRRVWPSIMSAHFALPGTTTSVYTRNMITRNAFKLIAEDGSEIRPGAPWKLVRPGGKYRMVILHGWGPAYNPSPRVPPPPGWPAGVPYALRPPPGPPMPFRRPVQPASVDSDSDSDDDDDEEVTWEIVQELGFEDRKPASTAKLSELLASWTNAPDTEFDADVSESVLGPMPDNSSDSSSSSGSGTTVD